MHHPPFRTGIAPMDHMGLGGGADFAEIIRHHPQVERILLRPCTSCDRMPVCRGDCRHSAEYGAPGDARSPPRRAVDLRVRAAWLSIALLVRRGWARHPHCANRRLAAALSSRRGSAADRLKPTRGHAAPGRRRDGGAAHERVSALHRSVWSLRPARRQRRSETSAYRSVPMPLRSAGSCACAPAG